MAEEPRADLAASGWMDQHMDAFQRLNFPYWGEVLTKLGGGACHPVLVSPSSPFFPALYLSANQTAPSRP